MKLYHKKTSLLAVAFAAVAAYCADIQTVTKVTKQVPGIGEVKYVMFYQTNLAKEGHVETISHRLQLERKDGKVETLWETAPEEKKPKVPPFTSGADYEYSTLIDISWNGDRCAVLMSMPMGLRFLRVEKKGEKWYEAQRVDITGVADMDSKVYSIGLKGQTKIVAKRKGGQEDVYEIMENNTIKKNGEIYQHHRPGLKTFRVP
jgi:hypothetical protein